MATGSTPVTSVSPYRALAWEPAGPPPPRRPPAVSDGFPDLAGEGLETVTGDHEISTDHVVHDPGHGLLGAGCEDTDHRHQTRRSSTRRLWLPFAGVAAGVSAPDDH